MSITRNFRVTINLSNFFHDHRTRARIFITDDIQTINDLEGRIEKIFNIQNFHLTCQNEYLPPSEDARILQKDDIIWVIQNGENHQSVDLSQNSSKTIKKSKTDSKKRPISLSDVYIEEELQSPQKKKKKKSDIDKNSENVINISSPLNERSKKKKKKKDKTSDVTSRESMNDISMEGFITPLNKETRSKGSVDISNKNDKASTTIERIEEEFNSSKNSVMNINTLLPVLHSHIKSYNKKISRCQLDKTGTSLMEISSSTTAKESESEDDKKQYTCKGNLPFYKRKIQLPTITDEYLNQKKVNIIKIEYLNRPKRKNNGKNITEPEQEAEICFPQEIVDKCSNDCKEVAVKGQNTDIATPNTISHNNLKESRNMENTLPFETTEVTKDVTTLSNTTKLSESNATLTYGEEKMLSTEELLIAPTSNTSKNTYTSEKKSALTFEENSSYKKDIKSVSPKLESTFLSNEETPLNNTHNINIGTDIVTNDSDASKPVYLSEQIGNSKESKTSVLTQDLDPLALETTESSTSVNTDLIKISSDVTVNTQKVILKKYDMPLRQKYFFFKGMTDHANSAHEETNMNKENSVSPKNVFFMPAKQEVLNLSTPSKSAPGTSEIELQQLNRENTPRSTEVPNSKITVFNSPSESNYADKLSNATETTFNDFAPSQKVNENYDINPIAANNNLQSNVINQTIPTIGSPRMAEDIQTKDPILEFDNNSINSNTCAMDLTKDVTDKFDNSKLSLLGQQNVSIFSKRKQQSGVGQLLEDLRSNESIISVESIDSDCSEFVTKRQRKRVRKRKRKNAKNNSDSSLNDSSLVITHPFVQQKSLNVKGCPSIHIKFEDEGEELKVIPIAKDKSMEVDNEPHIENITLKSDLDESKINMLNINEDDILNSPSMKKIFPSIGDLIAFKILRITENYTPEISSYIVGKVIEFDKKSQQVVYEILNGLDQCKEPKGKLSLEVGGSNKESSSNQREFVWLDLIGPRLLNP